jgi:hypothetical protein
MSNPKVNLEHLEWAIQARAKNQRSCFRLLTLFENHAAFWKAKKASRAAQDLVAVAFSLWRAAFLAEKTGSRAEVFAHGRDFLIRVIEDNAISYVQDKNSREWTFNYYTKNARSSLTLMSNYWSEVPNYDGKKRSPRERWDYCQELLDTAITNFEAKMAEAASTKERAVKARQTREAAKRRRRKVREITLSQRDPKVTE